MPARFKSAYRHLHDEKGWGELSLFAGLLAVPVAVGKCSRLRATLLEPMARCTMRHLMFCCFLCRTHVHLSAGCVLHAAATGGSGSAACNAACTRRLTALPSTVTLPLCCQLCTDNSLLPLLCCVVCSLNLCLCMTVGKEGGKGRATRLART